MPQDMISPERMLAGRRTFARGGAAHLRPARAGLRIFRLRKIDGLSQKEIAEKLGFSESIVENELSSGLRQISSVDDR